MEQSKDSIVKKTKTDVKKIDDNGDANDNNKTNKNTKDQTSGNASRIAHDVRAGPSPQPPERRGQNLGLSQNSLRAAEQELALERKLEESKRGKKTAGFFSPPLL